MGEKEELTPEKHKQQIEAYTKEYPHYETYAAVLKRVLEKACKVSFPEALVQSRPKGISSFAEKVARKFPRYPDAVHQMTDLCGARVIVQTAEQIKAVRSFIETHFKIVEKEDKGLLLSEDKFGYRDMHYIVQLDPSRQEALGIGPEEYKKIGDRKAEIQVRSWVQHAWADTLHDRIYKNKLVISPDIKRTGALLAALLEEADRSFDHLADELDGLIANYTAFAAKGEVEREIKVQELVLMNEPKEANKPGLALKLARLYAASGNYARVIELLQPHAGIPSADRCEFLSDLGFALCRLHRGAHQATEYRHGRDLLAQALDMCEQSEVPFAPNLRKRDSLHARILARLGWAVRPIPGQEDIAREYYRRAHESEPGNPYYLADMLGFEIFCNRSADSPESMRTTIREAIKTCRQHALAGIEMPYACFTAGRLSLLMHSPEEALGYYARGIRYYLAGTYFVPPDVIDIEIDWLRGLSVGKKTPAEHQRVSDFLELGKGVCEKTKKFPAQASISPPVLIIAGGAASMDPAGVTRIRPLIEAALKDFQGTVIAGGTTVGVPGCVGDVAVDLERQGKKRFQLIGYRPERFPDEVSAHKGYDKSVKIGDDFSPEQILQNWKDILAAGIEPGKVLLAGFGGGPLAWVEYGIALGLGASVGIVTGMGGTAGKLLGDPLWSAMPNLYPLPFDPMTVRAFVLPTEREFVGSVLEEMAREFHVRFVKGNTKSLPDNLKPWDKLNDSYKKANKEQAAYAVRILEAAGFGVREAEKPVIFKDFTDEEIEFMAQLEHGRWNVERLRDGWRHGPRNDSMKLHNCLVPWEELSDGPDGVRKYDRDAVRAFPEILAKAGLEVFRLKPSES